MASGFVPIFIYGCRRMVIIRPSRLKFSPAARVMRVYVDQRAVYFAFSNSINTQIFVTPSQHQLEVMAEDKQGSISATILNIAVTSRSLTTIRNIQSLPRWRSCSALFPFGFIQRVVRHGAINRILMLVPKVVTGFPTVADAGLESARKHGFGRLICEVGYGESASNAQL